MRPVTARELILSGARLAGAGLWQIVIPFQSTTTAADAETGAPVTTKPLTIAGNNSCPGPTLMERWELSSLHLPVGLLLKHAKLAAPPKANIILTMRRNGDIVFSDEAPSETNQFTETESGVNVRFVSDLVNSVSLDRSQQLTVEVSVASPTAILKGTVILVAGEQILSANPAVVPQPGYLGYDVAQLTGHRTL